MPGNDLQLVGRLVGRRYRLLDLVGIGGMANVYRARDERLKREVAVKLLAGHFANDPQFVRRFRREAELCAPLGHPNVVTVLDAGAEPRDFIVMELIDGVDLGTLSQRRGRLAPAAAADVLAQVCHALEHVHDKGVLHRDVSPRNILLRGRDGTVKLIDFGLACPSDDAPVTCGADIAGTPGYVAPEVLDGASPTALSDLYSLGAVAYQLLAGPPGFGHRDAARTGGLATATPRPTPLGEVRPDLPRGLARALEQAMAPAPAGRQRCVAELRTQLIEVLGAPAPLHGAGAAPLEPVRAGLAPAA